MQGDGTWLLVFMAVAAGVGVVMGLLEPLEPVEAPD